MDKKIRYVAAVGLTSLILIGLFVLFELSRGGGGDNLV